jgi:hypothetical protein
MPIGLGLSFVAITIAATTGVPARESGLASGLLTTAQQIGGSLGLAILSGIAASATAAALLTNGGNQASGFVTGFHAAYYAGIAFALLASLVALVFIRRINGPVAEVGPALH